MISETLLALAVTACASAPVPVDCRKEIVRCLIHWAKYDQQVKADAGVSGLQPIDPAICFTAPREMSGRVSRAMKSRVFDPPHFQY